MKNIFLGTLAFVLLPGIASGSSPSNPHQISQAVRVDSRALPDAPKGYAPVHVKCPAKRPRLRNAATISPEEESWLKTRRDTAASALKDFFGHVKIDNFDALSYLESHSHNASSQPIIGITISGGGHRACLNGAGAIKAFDSRTKGATTKGATTKGQLGGLLQSSTYVSALSGGSWMLASVFVNNFTTISALQDELWDFSSESVIQGPASMQPDQFWGNISTQVGAKKAAGFVTGDADIWGRMQGYYFFNASHGGVDLTWSSIAKTRACQAGDMPLPLVVSKGQYFVKSAEDPTLKEPVYEFSPWEFGSYDDSIHGFAPLEYLGTRFVNGIVPDDGTCVQGFDNAGLIIGTSSDIWNEKSQDLAARIRQISNATSTNTTEGAQALKTFSSVLKAFFGAVSSTNSTVNGPASYEPNPFYKYHTKTSPFAQDKGLTVVDGGEDGQNIAINPLIQRKRNVDVIFAVDSGADSYPNTWPNGEALVATYKRTLAGIANDTSFPPIPDNNTFVNLGLNSHPTFFGCNSTNLTTPAPLVVYLPNHPITYMSNVSQDTTQYTAKQRDAMITNGYNIATQANGTLDSNWSTCVGCAVLSRSFDRTGTPVPEACDRCFQRYCWNGTVDSRTPLSYAPSMVFPSSRSASALASPTALNNGASLVPALWSALGALCMALFMIF